MNTYASPWKRIAATLIEVTLAGVFFLWIFTFISGSGNIASLFNAAIASICLYAILQTVFLFIQAWLTTRFGGNIGLLCTGLKVVGEDGRNLTFRRALLRILLAGALSSVLFPISYYWVFRDEKHRTWHDLATDTVVLDMMGATGSFIAAIFFVCLLGLGTWGILQHIQNFSDNALMYEKIGSDVSSGVAKQLRELDEDKKQASISGSPTETPTDRDFQY